MLFDEIVKRHIEKFPATIREIMSESALLDTVAVRETISEEHEWESINTRTDLNGRPVTTVRCTLCGEKRAVNFHDSSEAIAQEYLELAPAYWPTILPCTGGHSERQELLNATETYSDRALADLVQVSKQWADALWKLQKARQAAKTAGDSFEWASVNLDDQEIKVAKMRQIVERYGRNLPIPTESDADAETGADAEATS